MDRREKYDYLMGIIDRWTVEKPTEQRPPFKHLQEGALVRETVVTPGSCTSVPGLKTYFATEILEIYPSRTRITWNDIRRALAGETDKKYNFDFKMLDQCFSPKENRDAAKGIQLLAESSELAESLEEWEDIPVYLLERLQEVFRKKLGEYWRMCDESRDGAMGREKASGHGMSLEPAEKDGENKKRKYMECVRTLALHEIFVRKFLETWDMMTEEVGRHLQMFNKMSDKAEETISRFSKAEEDKKKELAEQMESLSRESMENIKWHGKCWVLMAVCLEHMISLGAEIQIIMLLEKKRLDEIDEGKGSPKFETEKYLEFMRDRYLTSMDKYNKNKRKYYNSLENRVRDVFFRYIDSISGSGVQDISQTIEAYLRIVEQGKWSEEQGEELRAAQNIIAAPLLNEPPQSYNWVHQKKTTDDTYEVFRQ